MVIKQAKPSPEKVTSKLNFTNLLFTICVTACIIMIIFISLEYLMDVIANEAYRSVPTLEKTMPLAVTK